MQSKVMLLAICALQVTASFRVVDGIVLVVDAVEGVMLNVSKYQCHAYVN